MLKYDWLRRALFVVLLLAAGLAGTGLYSRYFDESGGAFCSLRHEAVQLRNMKICHWTGVNLEVLDLRYSGNPHMVLIKYTGGTIYQCFWFDDREFEYSIDDLKTPFIESCPNNQRNLIMTRKVEHD